MQFSFKNSGQTWKTLRNITDKTPVAPDNLLEHEVNCYFSSHFHLDIDESRLAHDSANKYENERRVHSRIFF